MWIVSLIIIAAGAIGGVLNALLTDNGFIKWRTDVIGNMSVWRPGVLGNIFTIAVCAFLSWALYGPVTNVDIMTSQVPPPMTLATVGGALLVGIAGARWLTNEVDKKILKAGMMDMASKMGNDVPADQFMKASPTEAVQMASSRT